MNSFLNMNKMAGSNGPSSTTSNSYFSRIRSATSNLSTNTILIIGAVIFFVVLAVYYYYNYVSPKLKPSYNPNAGDESMNSMNQGSSSKQAELMLFYADWCPHCKTAKPIWSELKTEYQNKTINGYNILFTEINCTNENAETEQMMNKYNIEGFPTIKLLKDGQIVEYDAKPSKDTLKEFLNTVL